MGLCIGLDALKIGGLPTRSPRTGIRLRPAGIGATAFAAPRTKAGAGWRNRTTTPCLQGRTSATEDKPARFGNLGVRASAHDALERAKNLQTDGDLLSIPEEAVARSPSNSGRSRCQTARCRDGIDRHVKTRAQKRGCTDSVLIARLVLRTIGPSCHVAEGVVSAG